MVIDILFFLFNKMCISFANIYINIAYLFIIHLYIYLGEEVNKQ